MDDLISRRALYEKTAEWEAKAAKMVKATMYDDDLTEWRKWSAILAERTAFKYDVADAPSVATEYPEDWVERYKERILQAGMEGREVEFRIGGRLFAIREKAQ